MTMTPFRMLQVSTTKHEMTVLRDDGLYRHIRFQEPGTSIWHFDLVTWPGHLVITGDLEDFHFARIQDMFEFFRTKQVGQINESYWAEKLRGPVRTKSYSPERFKQLVWEWFWEARTYLSGPHAGLWRALCDDLLRDAEILDENEAHRRLSDFSYFNPVTRVVHSPSDTWEWDLCQWDWHFRVSLHAIVWGINRYDGYRAEQVRTLETTGGRL